MFEKPYLYSVEGQTEFVIRGLDGRVVLKKIKYLIIPFKGSHETALCRPFEFKSGENVDKRIETFLKDFNDFQSGDNLETVNLDGLHLVNLNGGNLGREN